MITERKDKKWVLDYLSKNKICAFATSNLKGKTEAAAMVFAYDMKLNFYLVTFKTARKCENLSKNKNVSIVVGVDYDSQCSLQVDGTAEILEGQAKQFALDLLSKRFSFVEDTPNAAFIMVKPTFMRLYEMSNGKDIFTRIM